VAGANHTHRKIEKDTAITIIELERRSVRQARFTMCHSAPGQEWSRRRKAPVGSGNGGRFAAISNKSCQNQGLTLRFTDPQNLLHRYCDAVMESEVKGVMVLATLETKLKLGWSTVTTV
jgi:hypothetical protein